MLILLALAGSVFILVGALMVIAIPFVIGSEIFKGGLRYSAFRQKIEEDRIRYAKPKILGGDGN